MGLIQRVKAVIRALLGRLIRPWLAKFPSNYAAPLFAKVIIVYAQSLPAPQALRFLFDLDARLYPLQGEKSIEYDGGIHTKHRHMRYHDFFVNRIRASERVLDVGCGIGAVAYDVAEKAGAYVVGIDLSAANIALAQERYVHSQIKYRVGNALQELPAGPFDVVVMSNVLEHLPERPAFLRRLQRSAQPSRFLIRVPVFERDWRVPLKRELGVEWRLDDTHETEYTLESFSEEMAEAGLSIAHQEVRWGEIWAEVRADEK